MSAPDYSVQNFDLAIPRDRTVLVEQGTQINGVVVQQVPAGALAFLHFGANRDPVPIVSGDSWEVSVDAPDGCPLPLNEGLFMTNPAGAGIVILIISFGRVGSGVRTVA